MCEKTKKVQIGILVGRHLFGCLRICVFCVLYANCFVIGIRLVGASG